MINKHFLLVSECCISDKPVSPIIVDKIIKWHILPLGYYSELTGRRVYCRNGKGMRSGFRSFRWEKSRGKIGDSEHCFGQTEKGRINPLKKGAIDLRCDDWVNERIEFAKELLTYTFYTRIIIYPFHIHADYALNNGYKHLFIQNKEEKIELCVRQKLTKNEVKKLKGNTYE